MYYNLHQFLINTFVLLYQSKKCVRLTQRAPSTAFLTPVFSGCLQQSYTYRWTSYFAEDSFRQIKNLIPHMPDKVFPFAIFLLQR